MKKYLLTALIACISYLASAQRTQHALGFHIGGSTIDLEYQYHMSEKNFLDFTVGVFNLDDGILDYRPMVAIALGHDSGLVDHGFFNIGVTMTYRF